MQMPMPIPPVGMSSCMHMNEHGTYTNAMFGFTAEQQSSCITTAAHMAAWRGAHGVRADRMPHPCSASVGDRRGTTRTMEPQTSRTARIGASHSNCPSLIVRQSVMHMPHVGETLGDVLLCGLSVCRVFEAPPL